ncbi:probable inactive tRNA-specific adenosine deaminase-like protein 3 [Nematostella vectensis]|uniref:probable inactive tRNA-specific adenosine deaminase-like protein 3 n=1 Tax=Nematostella vectensis TaxID=45351 RepID=UPI00207759B4|nr:probable inactive tRNA-specific adenosine deaminase-like protein 3 [Nematostella vectensis]
MISYPTSILAAEPQEQQANHSVKAVAILADEFLQELETVPVFACEIKDRKQASRCIRELKEAFNFSDLMHLKRIRSLKTRNSDILHILLCPVSHHTSAVPSLDYQALPSLDDQALPSLDDHHTPDVPSLDDILHGTDVSREGLGEPFLVNVAKTQPHTRAQYQKASELWPTNFHEEKYISRLIGGELFTTKELETISSYVRFAQQAAQYAKSKQQVGIGAAMVDPETKRVVAVACDLRHHGHPLQHAVMVVIDLVAQSQGAGSWCLGGRDSSGIWSLKELIGISGKNDQNKTIAESEISKWMTSAKICMGFNEDNRNERLKQGGDKVDASLKNINSKLDLPYLCTGYDLYVTQEPCVMCAMALVHSRIRRVFYSCGDSIRGALGSKYKLHTQKALNHHFEHNIFSAEHLVTFMGNSNWLVSNEN